MHASLRDDLKNCVADERCRFGGFLLQPRCCGICHRALRVTEREDFTQALFDTCCIEEQTYVLDKGKAIRYGVTVGEEALIWSGVAKIGRKEEWPSWVPTPSIKKRLGDIPDFIGPGPHNPLGARGLYLYVGNKDTLYRIHGTNQPEHIGSSISSGCIRMFNEDVIDLYNRVKVGTPVVVLKPTQGGNSSNPRVVLGVAPKMN
jgi:hypothetical protein